MKLLWVSSILSLWQLSRAFQSFGLPYLSQKRTALTQPQSQQYQYRKSMQKPSNFPITNMLQMTTSDVATLESKAETGELDEPPADNFKRGPFTREEDFTIAGRVMVWGDKGDDELWSNLQEELGREKDSIKARFSFLAVRKFRVIWTKDLDDQLEQLVNTAEKPVKWSNIGKAMDLKPKEVRCRWHTHHLALQTGRNVGPWSEEEIAKLKEIVDNLPLGEPVKWEEVGEKVLRTGLSCARQWHEIMRNRLRFSEFTPQEDAYIWKTVRELGTKSRRVFENMQQVLHRHASQIRVRFYGYLMQSFHNVDMYPKTPEKIEKWLQKRRRPRPPNE